MNPRWSPIKPLYATSYEAALAAEKRVAEAFEKGKADGWEACETCHGIVDGKLPNLKSKEF